MKAPLTLNAFLDTLWWTWVNRSCSTTIWMYVGGLIIHLPQVWCTTSDSISPLLFLHPLSEGCGTRLTNPNYSETSKLVYFFLKCFNLEPILHCMLNAQKWDYIFLREAISNSCVGSRWIGVCGKSYAEAGQSVWVIWGLKLRYTTFKLRYITFKLRYVTFHGLRAKL